MTRAGAIALAMVGLWTAACSIGPAISARSLSGWHAVDDAGFRLIGDAPPDRLRKLADELALFDRVFARLARLPAEPVGPVSIFLLRDPGLARRFGLGGLVAGWTFATLDGSFAAVLAHQNHVETRLALFHEYTHVLLHRNRRAPLPPWYNEGLSTYFDTLNVRDGAVVVGSAQGELIGWISKRGPIPLERLFEGAAWGGSADAVRDFYATAWALSHHLLASPRGRLELSRFAERLERGAAWREAYAASFDRPIGRLEAELAAHVALLARGAPVEAVFDARDLGPRRALELVPLSTAEVAYDLGYLALRLGEEDESGARGPLARTLLSTALSEGSSAARADAALAEALAVGGDVEEGLARIEHARTLAPGDVRVLLHAGRVGLAGAESAEAGSEDSARALRVAEEAYERALALDPSSAVGWEGLGRTRRRAGRRDQAIAALERARGLGWSASLDLELGRLYLELGRTSAALPLLQRLAQDPHGGRTSEDARELLDDLLAAEAPRP